MQRWGEAGGGASHRWQRPLSRSVRVCDVGGVSGGSGEPRALCLGPYLSFCGAVRRRPTNHGAAGRPRSRRGSEDPIDRGQLIEINLTGCIGFLSVLSP